MKHFDVLTHRQNGCIYVMVRNKNTSYAMGEFAAAEYKKAVDLVVQHRDLDDKEMLGIYINAKRKNLFCLRYEYSFKDQRNAYVRPLSPAELEYLNIKEGLDLKRAYCVCVKVPREVIVVKKKLRKDCEAILKSWRDEYTMEELIEKVKEKVRNKKAAKKAN